MVRVHELAAELEVPSAKVIEILKSMGIEARSHMKVISDSDVARVRSALKSRAVRGETVRGKRDFRVRDISAPKSPSVRPRPEIKTEESRRVVTRKVIKKIVRRSPAGPAEEAPQAPKIPSIPEEPLKDKPARPDLPPKEEPAPREQARTSEPSVARQDTQRKPVEKDRRDDRRTDRRDGGRGPGPSQDQKSRGFDRRRGRHPGDSPSQVSDRDTGRRYEPVGKRGQDGQKEQRGKPRPPRPKIPRIPVPSDYLKPREGDLENAMQKLASGGMRSTIDSKKDKVVGKTLERDDERGQRKRRRKIITGSKKPRTPLRAGGRGRSKREQVDTMLDTSTTIRRKGHKKGRDRQVFEEAISVKRNIRLDEHVSIRDLSAQTGLKSSEIIAFLMKDLEVFATINQVVDQEIAGLICENFGFAYDLHKVREVEDVLHVVEDRPEDLVVRAPVVTVLGHVDHGKTKLLDAIRGTDVVATEAGGITQKIGAFMVDHTYKDGASHQITFIDTPGHAAFTAMRARGAQVTDVAILVVAANDGVMPQTREAIDHARSAGVEIVVAINKIDLPEANPELVKQQLAELGLVPEEWGGNTIMVPISAKRKIGIEDLLENVLTVTDVLELKGNPNAMAEGYIIEARLDKGRGALATVLVQRGTLNIGDYVVAGKTWGRIRQMTDEDGVAIEKALPSTPVLISGLNNVPAAGDKLNEIADEKTAREIFDKREMEHRQGRLRMVNTISLEDFYDRMTRGETKELNIILKADLQGSIEALQSQLDQLSTSEVAVKFIHTSVGNITDSDVMLAIASHAIILGFNVVASPEIRKQASMEGIDIRTYNIIYKAVEDIHAALEGLLEPVFKESILGIAEVRQVFKKTGKVVIAGLGVLDGKLVRGSKIRIKRENEIIHETELSNLRHFDQDVKEIGSGQECGVMLDGFNDLREGDVIEAYETVKVLRTLEKSAAGE